MRLSLAVLAVAVVTGGCAGDSSSYALMDDDFPAGGCRDTEQEVETSCDTDAVTGADTDTSGTPSDNSCVGSNDCMGGHCVAPWNPQTQTRAEFACEFACIATLDEVRWCADKASCCDPDATCTDRGYCIFDVDVTSGTTTEQTSTTSGNTTTSDSTSSPTEGSSSGTATDTTGSGSTGG